MALKFIGIKKLHVPEVRDSFHLAMIPSNVLGQLYIQSLSQQFLPIPVAVVSLDSR